MLITYYKMYYLGKWEWSKMMEEINKQVVVYVLNDRYILTLTIMVMMMTMTYQGSWRSSQGKILCTVRKRQCWRRRSSHGTWRRWWVSLRTRYRLPAERRWAPCEQFIQQTLYVIGTCIGPMLCDPDVGRFKVIKVQRAWRQSKASVWFHWVQHRMRASFRDQIKSNQIYLRHKAEYQWMWHNKTNVSRGHKGSTNYINRCPRK